MLTNSDGVIKNFKILKLPEFIKDAHIFTDPTESVKYDQLFLEESKHKKYDDDSIQMKRHRSILRPGSGTDDQVKPNSIRNPTSFYKLQNFS